MALSTRTIMFAAAAALVAAAPAMSSAPYPAKPVADEAFRPGMDGVDVAAITGAKGSASGRTPACADPARRGDLRPC